MIIVKLMGGLGNQMFQYAAGRRLAHIHGTELKLDHTFLEDEKNFATSRMYELYHLNVSCSRASRADCYAVAKYGRKGLRRFIGSINPFPESSRMDGAIRERSFQFDHSFLTLSDNVYLEGYWQSECYFADISNILREDFSFCEPLAGENLRIANVIKNCSAVSLHVRRGDYVSDQQTAALHGVCELDYYARAIAVIERQVPAPHFFVFSDDILWARKNLKFDVPMTFVCHNLPDRGFEDLRLMSLCRHHIIANSSFSWWGAWLNPRQDKIVIAPARWFNDTSTDTSDLMPASWLRLSI